MLAHEIALKEDGAALSVPGFEFSKRGLVITGRPSFEKWAELGETLQTMESGVQFWRGDWLNYGERAYGEKYSQFLGENDYQTLRDYAWVASSVQLSFRNDNLTWSHHRVVAPLEPEQQKCWLEKAEQEKWSKSRLRLEIKLATAAALSEFPEGRYAVIYADPPWSYANSGFDQSAASHYLTIEAMYPGPYCELFARNVRSGWSSWGNEVE